METTYEEEIGSAFESILDQLYRRIPNRVWLKVQKALEEIRIEEVDIYPINKGKTTPHKDFTGE